MAKKVKVEVEREELESLVEEANTVLGLDPEMVIKRKMSDEDLIELIKENLDEVRESDFTEDAENGPFSDEARKTIEALGINIEDDLEPVKEEPKKAAKGKKVVEEEPEEEKPKKGAKGKKEVQEELPLEKPAKKGKKVEPEPEPEEEEITLETVNEMDYKQLKSLVEEKELDIDIDDFPKKKIEELREAIIEALELEEEPEPEEKPKKGAKAKEEEKPAKKGKAAKEEVEEEKPKKDTKPAAKKDKPKSAKKEKAKAYGRMDSILESIKTNRCHTFEQHKEWSGKKYCKERDCSYVADYSNEWLRVALTVLEAEGVCKLNMKNQYDFND